MGTTPIEISITGEITHLDGVTFTATVTSESTEALSPDQSVGLKNIRVTVSGYYEDEL